LHGRARRRQRVVDVEYKNHLRRLPQQPGFLAGMLTIRYTMNLPPVMPQLARSR
jgi:hypothetical protein